MPPKNPQDLDPAESRNAPPESQTKDTYSHHSSPDPDDVQKQMPVSISREAGQPAGKTVRKTEVPMHVTKHPEPVGRPKNPRDYD
jgi:hypothetical protein